MSRLLVFLLLFACVVTLQAAPAVSVKLEGLNRAQAKNVRAYLTIEQERKADDLTEARIHRYNDRAPREIREALQPYGYYQPKIKSTLEHSGDSWVARYDIDPGPPVIISEVDVQIDGAGRDDPAIVNIAGSLPVEVGDRLVHAEYEQAKSRLREAAIDTGYRDARYLKSEVRVIQADDEAVVILHLDTGDKAYFGPVRFEGGNISDELLSRFVPFQTGDVWSTKQLLLLQRGLVDSGYFLSVNIVPQEPAAGSNLVPITVILTPYKLQKYSFGLGYSTNLGIQGSVDWLHRRINPSGHHLSAGASVSPVRQDANATYYIPLANPRTDVLEASGIYRHEDTVDVKTQVSELRLSRNIKRGDWREVLSVGYRHEVDDLADGAGVSNLLIPKGTWTLVEADNRMFATEGFRIDLETSGSTQALLSDSSFLQGIISGKLVHALGADGRLIVRGDIGATATGDFESLPATVRFFTGGDNSVRGYAYKSLAPENDDGDLIGGKYLLVGSMEYDYNVYKKWYLAAFYDIGNAFNDVSSIDAASGAGVGIRWASPVGMVRVDVASALSEAGNPWRLHISFGPDF
jgi:translocation and assembly module TamA